mmetsp:Transcript_3494/g.3053  ORF Transcript_3494/g.3053 Transcript_3494/m.3053 type:complete len:85 (-) Transcript_3494:125-379(-)
MITAPPFFQFFTNEIINKWLNKNPRESSKLSGASMVILNVFYPAFALSNVDVFQQMADEYNDQGIILILLGYVAASATGVLFAI